MPIGLNHMLPLVFFTLGFIHPAYVIIIIIIITVCPLHAYNAFPYELLSRASSDSEFNYMYLTKIYVVTLEEYLFRILAI